MEIEPSDAATLAGALRFERYSDAGSSLTGKLASRLELGESGASVRAAVSTGFRAPRLPQGGFNTIGFVGGSGGLVTAGFLPEGDPIACQDFGACSLGHETSLNVSGGLVYATGRGFSVSVDVYRVAVADAIVLTRSLTQEHGLRGGAQFQGRPVDAVSFWTNAVDTRTQGFDVVWGWRLRGMSWGVADLAASYHGNSTSITDNRNESFVGPTQQTIIEETHPGTRLGFSADFRLAGGPGLRLGANHIGSITTPFIFEENVTIDAATIADAEVSIPIGSRMRIRLGVKNLLDRLPNQLPADGVAQLWAMDYPTESPYGIAGRSSYMTIQMAGN